MTANFEALRQLFDQCVDLPALERADWLRTHVADDSDRAVLQRMLDADASATGPLRGMSVEWIDQLELEAEVGDAERSRVGERIGAFRLTKLLGAGGQGEVYQAERDSGEFTQQVAIKLLHRWIASPDDLRRFRRERDLLARFEHPGVARLIDGGVASDGLPYLVMEFIDGAAIDAYCAQGALSTTQRLQLMAQLCAIVADAHRALIVHRDLKPANVLVTRSGAVKVLDFGIARLLDDEESPVSRVMAWTPGYAAPEQLRGQRITTATDVYALGVMLSELLTGQKPTPDTPGPAAVPHGALAPELRWIIDRACAEPVEERYRDANALREDIDNHLAQRPVRAHPPSAWYRARKFVSRHRGGVTLTALLVLTTLISLTSALWQARVAHQQAARAEAEAVRAQAQATRAESVRTFVVDLFESAKQILPEDQRPTPDQLVRTARQQLDQDSAIGAALKADLYTTLSEVSIANGDFDDALAALDKVRGLPGFAVDPDIDRLWEATLRAQVMVELDRAETVQPLLAPFADEIARRKDRRMVNVLETITTAHLRRSEREPALRTAAQLAELSQHVVPALNAGDRIYYRLMPNVARMLMGEGRADDVAVVQAAIDEWHAAGLPQDLTYTQILDALAILKNRSGAADLGLADLQELLRLRRQILVAPHRLLISALKNQTLILRRLLRLDEAERSAREGLAMAGQLYGPHHLETLGARSGLATVLAAQGKRKEAIAIYRDLTSLCREVPEQADNPACAIYYQNLGHNLRIEHDLVGALAANDAAFAWQTRVSGDQHPQVGAIMIARAGLLFDMGQPVQALTALEKGQSLYERLGQRELFARWSISWTRARCLRALGRNRDALAQSEQAQSLIAQQPAPNPREVMFGAVLHALLLADDGQVDAARRIIAEYPEAVVPEHWHADEFEALRRLAEPK